MSSLRERVDDKNKDELDMVVIATEVMKYGNAKDENMMKMLQNKNDSQLNSKGKLLSVRRKKEQKLLNYKKPT